MSDRNQVMNAASELGSTAAMQYWNDVVNVGLALAERQSSLWSGMWQQVFAGALTPETMRADATRAWAEYLHAMSTWTMFPAQWWLRWIGDVPTTVFVLDLDANASNVQSIAAPSVVTPLALGCTDLQLVAGIPTPRPDGTGFVPGDARLPAEHILVRAAPFGERVDLQVVNLRAPPEMPAPEEVGLAPTGPRRVPEQYQYLGVLYGQELHVRRPLATLLVVFVPASNARKEYP